MTGRRRYARTRMAAVPRRADSGRQDFLLRKAPAMRLNRTHVALGVATLLAGSALHAPSAATSGVPTPGGSHHHHPQSPASAESAQVVLDWERISLASVFPATPVPIGLTILGFTSVAMYRAVQDSQHRRDSSETAAVAQAAHDVLVHYFPGAAAMLDDRLAATLATVEDGAAEDTGAWIGQRAAARMIRSRSGDGYADPTIHYTLPPGVGVWQPAPPATDMLGAWIGSQRPHVL